jgi:transcriptional regulator with XRE-family HTH domain
LVTILRFITFVKNDGKMVDRILEVIREKKLTPSQFADEIGAQRSGMSHILSGRNKPSLEFVMKILKRYPEIKAEWLLYGTSSDGTDQITDMIAKADAELKTGTERKSDSMPSPTLFDEPEVTGKPEIKTQRPIKKERTERKIEKIVVFYDDRSFREYEPER